MNKFKYLILTILLSSLYLSKVSASCTKEEIDAFKEIEEKYTVTYEFDKESKTYTLNFYNPDPEKYGYKLIVYEKEVKSTLELSEIKEEKFSYKNVEPGEYTIEVTGISNSCNDTLKTISLNLAKYNKYSEDALCQGIEEFVLCQQTYGKDIDYETFKSRVETYKKNKKSDTDVDNIDKDKIEKTKIDKIIEYVKINYVKISIITVFIILVIITVVISLKSLRKSRRLE